MSVNFPAWTDMEINSEAEAVALLGSEATARVLLDRAREEASKINQHMKAAGVPFPVRDAINVFFLDLALEISEVSARIGYALAQNTRPLAAYEDIVREAIARSDMDHYQYPDYLRWKVPTRLQ